MPDERHRARDAGGFAYQPQHEMTDRRLVPPDQVLATLSWSRKEFADRLLQLALDADRHDRAR